MIRPENWPDRCFNIDKWSPATVCGCELPHLPHALPLDKLRAHLCFQVQARGVFHHVAEPADGHAAHVLFRDPEGSQGRVCDGTVHG